MPKTYAILGNGRFGAYLAEQLRNRRIRVTTFEPPNSNQPADTHAPKDIQDFQEILLCVPIQTLQTTLETYGPHIQKGAFLQDVCSVKVIPHKILTNFCQESNTSFLGTHPLFGPQSAPNNCAGQRIALCPPTKDAPVPEAAMQLWQNTLSLKIYKTTPEEHDIQIANSQVLNHFVGRASALAKISRVELSTKTHEEWMDIQDIVCGNSLELFQDMNRFNPYAQQAREKLLQALQTTHKSLTNLKP
jgi:prephenate dehydrogenase